MLRTDGPRRGLSSDIGPFVGRPQGQVIAVIVIPGQRSTMITPRHLDRFIGPAKRPIIAARQCGATSLAGSPLAKPRLSDNSSSVTISPLDRLAFNTRQAARVGW